MRPVEQIKRITTRTLKQYPWLRTATGSIALGSAAGGTVASIVGNLSVVQTFLSNAFGITWLKLIHYSMAVVVALILVLGYVAGWVWVYRKYLLRLNLRTRRFVGIAGGVLAIPLAIVGYVAALPSPPNN